MLRYLFVFLFFSSLGYSQQILSINQEENAKVYLLRKEDSSVLKLLDTGEVVLAEESPASMVKVLFYEAASQAWTAGYVHQKSLHYLGSATKAEKTRFSLSYLQNLITNLSLSREVSPQAAASYNLLIDLFLEQSCTQKNASISKLFVASLFGLFDPNDEKQVYALEQMYGCQKACVDEALSKEKSIFVRDKIESIIQEL